MAAGKHRTAVEKTLDLMRERYDAMLAADDPRDRVSRIVTMAAHEAIMRPLADARDGALIATDEEFAQGATHAIGNVLASLTSCFTSNDTEMEGTARNLLLAVVGRTLQRVAEPDRNVVVWPAPAAEAAE